MKFQNLSKTYNGKKVLRIEEFSFLPGGIYAVVGPNGSGKSTMARIAAGLLEPDDRGSVVYNNGESAAYMPQKSFGFQMSVRKNILMAAPGTRVSMEKASRLLDRLEMRELVKARANRLSGGETARMALIRVLMTEKKLLILDEPTAAFDMKSTLAAEEMIREYRMVTQGTILLVTHSLAQARRLADYMLFLHEGRLVEHGLAENVLTAPQRPETRAFFDFYGA
jgi:tungstate transport system ATP-binding protein